MAQTPKEPAQNKTNVDIDLAAWAYVAGRVTEKLQYDGDGIRDNLVGCITTLYPETDNYETIRYIRDAHMRAEQAAKPPKQGATDA